MSTRMYSVVTSDGSGLTELYKGTDHAAAQAALASCPYASLLCMGSWGWDHVGGQPPGTRDLTYRVFVGDADRASRYGSSTWTATEDDLADQVARDTRDSMPWAVDGRDIRVFTWPSREGEHYSLPVPDGARERTYAATEA